MNVNDSYISSKTPLFLVQGKLSNHCTNEGQPHLIWKLVIQGMIKKWPSFGNLKWKRKELSWDELFNLQISNLFQSISTAKLNKTLNKVMATWKLCEKRNTAHKKKTLEFPERLWKSLDGSGWFWKALEVTWGHWKYLNNSGSLWTTLKDSGRKLMSIEGSGSIWPKSKSLKFFVY